jgi:YVTN family beta-propeller protein
MRRLLVGLAVVGFAIFATFATSGTGSAAAPTYRYSVTGFWPTNAAVVSLAVDADLHRLHYALAGRSSLVEVNTQTGGVLGTVALDFPPIAIASDTYFHLIYAAGIPGNTFPGRLCKIPEDTEVACSDDASNTEAAKYIVVDPRDHYLYAADTINGVDRCSLCVTLFDASIRVQIATALTSITPDPVLALLFVGGTDFVAGNVVYVIDTTHFVLNDRQSVRNTIQVPAQPRGLAFDRESRKLYATTPDAKNTVTVINMPTNSVIGTIPVGASPTDIAADSSTHTVYVSDQGSNRLAIIDGTAGALAGTVYLGSMPGQIQLDATTHTAYVATPKGVSVVQQQACPPAPGGGLQVSTSPYRANPRALSGATVTGNTYIYDDAACTTRSVSFALDGAPVRVESSWPYDLAGTGDTTALPSNLAKGTHTLTAVITPTTGAATTDTATFTVS